MKYTLKEGEKNVIRSKLANVLRDDDIIEFAYIHGSFLNHEFGDIDVAVYLSKVLDKKKGPRY